MLWPRAADARSRSMQPKVDQSRNIWRMRTAAFVVLIVGSIYLTAARWVPVPVRDVLFVIVFVFLPIVLNVAGWWHFRHPAPKESSAGWRRLAAGFGLLANSLAIAVVWGAFLYSYLLLNYVGRHRLVAADEMIDGRLVLTASLALAAFSMVAGAMAPRGVRLPLLLCGLIVGSAALIIPLAIL